MSLISEKDRQLCIKALEYYIQYSKNLKDSGVNIPDSSMIEMQTLLNWIKLEAFKNGDSSN